MSEISSYHLSSHPELYEPTRSNCFEFILNDNLSTMLMAGISDAEGISHTEDEYFTNAQQVITLSVVESSAPSFSIDPIEIRRGNSKMLFAGLPSFNSGSLKLNDYVGARTADVMLAWQARAYNVADDTVKLASNYKYDCTLKEWNPDMTKVIRTWNLVGCWCSAVEFDTFNVESNEKRSINATIQYDRAIPVDIVKSSTLLNNTTNTTNTRI